MAVRQKVARILSVPLVSVDHEEKAFGRAWREITALLHTVRFWLGEIAAGAIGTLALGGIGAAVAIVFLFLLILLMLWVTAPIRQRNEARTELSDFTSQHKKFGVGFSWESNYLQVGIRNGGPSLNSAIINFVVPQSFRRVVRLEARARPAATGSQLSTPEELMPGEHSIYWQEADMTFPGFGTSTLLYFLVPGLQKEEKPVSFRIGGDEIGGWLSFDGLIGNRPGSNDKGEQEQ